MMMRIQTSTFRLLLMWGLFHILVASPASGEWVYRQISVPYVAGQIGEITSFRVYNWTYINYRIVTDSGAELRYKGKFYTLPRVFRFGVGQHCYRRMFPYSSSCGNEICDPIDRPMIGRMLFADDETIYTNPCCSSCKPSIKYPAYPQASVPTSTGQYIPYSGSGVLHLGFQDWIPEEIPGPTLALDPSLQMTVESVNPRTISRRFRLADVATPHDQLHLVAKNAADEVISEIYLGQDLVQEVAADGLMLGNQPARLYRFSAPLGVSDGEVTIEASVRDEIGRAHV